LTSDIINYAIELKPLKQQQTKKNKKKEIPRNDNYFP